MREANEDASPTIDLEQLITHMDGDASLFRRMVSLFLAEAPKKMEGIRAAVESGNAQSLLKLSHALKGSAANLFAEPAVAALLRLESIARESDVVQAPAAYRELTTQIEKLKRELTHLVDSDYIAGFVNQQEHLAG
jgi:HPt (histidine-containing phosphotransfer) domain-containing protein